LAQVGDHGLRGSRSSVNPWSSTAGEAGLRIGEIRALDWRRDVDLVAGTITVNRQTRRGETTTPKGRTRRTIPLTETLLAALKALDRIRTGFVIRGLDGEVMTLTAS
jgi:integrase